MKKILTAALLFSITACGQTGTTATKDKSADKTVSVKPIEGWETLDNAAYSIQYPKEWELNQGGQMGTSFFLFSPLDSPEDSFRENVNLLIQDVSGQNIDLDEYTRISIEQLEKMMPNSAVVESKRIKNVNGEYQKMVYTGDQGTRHLKFEQYYWVIGGKALVLTLTAEADKFAKYQQTGEKIMNSFVYR